MSAAIYYPEQFAIGGSLGLQLKGKATHASVNDVDEEWQTFTIIPDAVTSPVEGTFVDAV